MPRNYIKKNNRSSCDMNYISSYRTPCQGLPIDSDFTKGQMGGDISSNHVDNSMGCVSYNFDLTSPQVAGQPIIGGNPSNCLSSQMTDYSNFNPVPQNNQIGGGASCSGVGFDLSDQIAGMPVITRNAPNCLYGETTFPRAIISGGGKKKKRGKSLRNRPPTPAPNKKKKKLTKIKLPKTKRNKILLKKGVERYCKRKNIKCSKKLKNKIYNTVINRLCN
jgi:hypothetical protein